MQCHLNCGHVSQESKSTIGLMIFGVIMYSIRVIKGMLVSFSMRDQRTDGVVLSVLAMRCGMS